MGGDDVVFTFVLHNKLLQAKVELCCYETHLSQQGDVVVAFFCEPDYLELLAC